MCRCSHPSLLMVQFFGTIASEAEKLLRDFHSCVFKQEDMLKAYAEQQREAHLRAVEATRSVSKITLNLFDTLDLHASKLSQIVVEAQKKKLVSSYLSLRESSRYLPILLLECAANKERQMLEKIAELLASSNARKKKMVQMGVHDFRESATSKATKLHEEMSTMVNSTSNVKAEWNLHVEKVESQYIEDTSAIEAGRKDLEEVLQCCFEKTKMGVDRWKSAKESLMGLEKSYVASISSIVRNATEMNETLHTRVSTTLSATLDNVEISNENLLSSTARYYSKLPLFP
ncbi:hypothetical protein MLD38_011617 [Melastoma candidum]|uniref:Uncharacterized protein n=1 Tax=Melastoma candidum TaxID=119954 RepID=A0ACB9R5D2_9MYRT|nr:hypothetical protein MLD38_011617 [Melastoma candidum]